MKLAFSTLGTPGWSLDQVIAGARRYGYDGVELRLLDGEIITPALPQGERTRVREAFAAAALPICCLDSSLRVATGVAPEETAQEIRDFLALAAELGAPMIRVFGGECPGRGAPRRGDRAGDARHPRQRAHRRGDPAARAEPCDRHPLGYASPVPDG